MKNEARKHFLDNIRWITVCLVVLYHVIGTYSVGNGVESPVVSNFQPGGGYSALGAYCYFVYPWFMLLLFIVSGISANLSLNNCTLKEFIRSKANRFLPAFFGYLFLLGWFNGWATDYQNDIFSRFGTRLPGLVKYVISCIIGLGPQWFLMELFLAYLALVLILKLDRKQRLTGLGGKCTLSALLLMFFPVWGSSYVLNTPIIAVFRNGFYWFGFLLGYFVFAHEEVRQRLKKWAYPLFTGGTVTGIFYVCTYWGLDYTAGGCLKNPLTNGFAWLMCLGALGMAQRALDFSTPFTEYMRKSSYPVYLLHYSLMILGAVALDQWPMLPAVLKYAALLLWTLGMSALLAKMIPRIPGLRYWLLGRPAVYSLKEIPPNPEHRDEIP